MKSEVMLLITAWVAVILIGCALSWLGSLAAIVMGATLFSWINP